MKRVSRIAALLLSAVLLASLPVLPASASEVSGLLPRTHTAPAFSDVSPDAWYYENVKAVCEYGLMVGKSDSVFDPDAHGFDGGKTFFGSDGSVWTKEAESDADRAAFARIISEALADFDLPAVSDVEDASIPDVSLYTDDSEREAVYRLYRAGILTGKGADGRFCPDDTLRRCEAAAVITRVADPSLRQTMRTEASPAPAVFTDEYARDRLADISGGQPVYALASGDYDGDGSQEAFAVVGMGPGHGPMALWFISGQRADRLYRASSPLSCPGFEDPWGSGGGSAQASPLPQIGSRLYFHTTEVSNSRQLGYMLWTVEDGRPVRVELPAYEREDDHTYYRTIAFDSARSAFVITACCRHELCDPRSGLPISGLNGEPLIQYRLFTWDEASGSFVWTMTRYSATEEWVPCS